MKWIIPGPNAKVLAQAIHCLAKLGENLYLEGVPLKLSFRTVNLSKTAYASFNFSPDFFSFYPVVQLQDIPRCEISMKAALIVFRFPSGMEKTVESCGVTLTNETVEFRLKFKLGFVKKNKIQLIECETLQASYEDEELPSRVVFEARVLSNILASFHNQEITWAMSSTGVKLRNFSEYNDDGDGLRSEVYVSLEDTLELVVAEEVELTFCLAELRTVITFAEQMGCPITVSFSEPGKPVFFIVKTDTLMAHVVLATLGLSSSQSSAASSSVVAEEDVQPRRKQAKLDDRVIPSSCDSAEGMDINGSSIERVEGNAVSRGSEFLLKVFTRGEYDVTKLPGYDVILAADSDDELDS